MLIVGHILLAVLSVAFAYKLIHVFRLFTLKNPVKEKRNLDSLPSVSVCIPARNETHAMTQCLERVLASDYPKLEIIVLDDSSVDNTSTLIKAFAHSGVRFVEGSPLPDDWLGKNHALQGLLSEASGTFVIFMGVDTQIQPKTISRLMSYIQREKADMVSILPRRFDSWRFSTIFSGLRFFWTLILHSKKSPAVSSNVWVINRDMLKQVNGFEPYRMHVIPEVAISRQVMSLGRYRFLISDDSLGVSYEKKYSSLVESAIRLYYPMLGKKWYKAVIGFLLMLVLISPLFITLSQLQDATAIWKIGAFWQLFLFGSIYSLYLSYVWARGWWLGFVLWPIALVQSMTWLVLSVFRYSMGQVTWKGRSITSRTSATSQKQVARS